MITRKFQYEYLIQKETAEPNLLHGITTTPTTPRAQSPEGTLLVMDPEAAGRDRHADPTKRIWCIYEFFHTLQLGKPLLIKVMNNFVLHCIVIADTIKIVALLGVALRCVAMQVTCLCTSVRYNEHQTDARDGRRLCA